MKKSKWKIGEILLKLGLIDEQQLDAGLTYQRLERGHDQNVLLGEFFTKHRIVSPKIISTLLAYQLKRDEPKQYRTIGIEDERFRTILDRETIKHYGVFPMVLKENEEEARLFLAMRDPNDRNVIEDLQFKSGYFIKPVLADAKAIEQAIEKYYPE